MSQEWTQVETVLHARHLPTMQCPAFTTGRCLNPAKPRHLHKTLTTHDHRSWDLPPFWCSEAVLLRPTGVTASCSSQHAAAQQVEFGPPIHGPLQQLQPVDLPFDGPSAPGLDKGGQHRAMVAHDAARKRVEHRPFRVGQLSNAGPASLYGAPRIRAAKRVASSPAWVRSGAASARCTRNAPSCASSLSGTVVSSWAQRRLGRGSNPGHTWSLAKPG